MMYAQGKKTGDRRGNRKWSSRDMRHHAIRIGTVTSESEEKRLVRNQQEEED